jgi:hypothetical protein
MSWNEPDVEMPSNEATGTELVASFGFKTVSLVNVRELREELFRAYDEIRRLLVTFAFCISLRRMVAFFRRAYSVTRSEDLSKFRFSIKIRRRGIQD